VGIAEGLGAQKVLGDHGPGGGNGVPFGQAQKVQNQQRFPKGDALLGCSKNTNPLTQKNFKAKI
jgi:hypothetical protein